MRIYYKLKNIKSKLLIKMKNILKILGKRLNNKKGTTMVEAAIVLPLVILSVMALIYLLINIYSTVALQSHMHLLLREESSIKSGMSRYEITDGYKRDKIRRKAESTNIELDSSLTQVSAQKNVVYKTNMIIKKAPKVKNYGRSYINRESTIVRLRSFGSIS